MADRSGDYSGSRWRGKVVNVMDPFRQGRVQVRVFGLHDNESMIPNADLPWAQPKVPLTHGASLKGISASPVGVVPGSIVDGYFADSERSILIADGTLPSAGSTQYGRVVDGSYAINPATNDIALAAREQDLNAALGGKNLTALAAAGLKFASLSAGIGVLPNIPTSLVSTMMKLDPSNMSGSLGGAMMAISKLQAIDAFSSPSGLLDIGSSSLTRGLSSLMGSIGIDKTLGLINSINPASLSPQVLQATNLALGNISSAFQSGMPNPLGSLSAPSFDPTSFASLAGGPFGSASQTLMGQLSGISTISQLGSLGGIDALAGIPGGIGVGQSLLSDIASTSFISSFAGGITSAAGLASGLSSVMSGVQLGGLNMLFGSSLTDIGQLSSIAANIVPSLSSVVSSVQNLTSISSALSAFSPDSPLPTIPNVNDMLQNGMIAKLKTDVTKLMPGIAPPVPEASTTTDSVAATTPAPTPPSPPAPTVGAAQASSFVGEQPPSVNPPQQSTFVGEEPPQADPAPENASIMKQEAAQESGQTTPAQETAAATTAQTEQASAPPPQEQTNPSTDTNIIMQVQKLQEENEGANVIVNKDGTITVYPDPQVLKLGGTIDRYDSNGNLLSSEKSIFKYR